MSKLSIIEEVGVIKGTSNQDYQQLAEEIFGTKTCFWCDKKPIKGRTSCAYHVGGTNVKISNPHGDNYPIGFQPE